jgi:hypothetical protein
LDGRTDPCLAVVDLELEVVVWVISNLEGAALVPRKDAGDVRAILELDDAAPHLARLPLEQITAEHHQAASRSASGRRSRPRAALALQARYSGDPS